MKRFVLVSGDFTTQGGMDCANFQLARYFADVCGFSVHLVAFNVDPSLANHPNVTWHRVARLFDSYTLSEGRLDCAGRAVARLLPDARVIVNGGNCDIGDVNWVHYVHAAWRAHSRGSLAMKFRREVQHRQHLRRERRLVPRAKLIIANSQRTRADLIDHLGIEPDRIKTVYYGIDASRFSRASPAQREGMRRVLGLDDSSQVVAFVGALGDRRKGFDLLFEAWRTLVAQDGWDATLLVIGQGEEASRWQSAASSCGLGNSIRFLGFRSDVAEVLKACDLLVSPTRYEAYGLGVHEALCCGIPALVSAAAGVAERVPAELASSLLIAEPLSADGVVRCLRNWRTNRRELATQVGTLSQTLREHSWDAMGRQMLEWIEPGWIASRSHAPAPLCSAGGFV